MRGYLKEGSKCEGTWGVFFGSMALWRARGGAFWSPVKAFEPVGEYLVAQSMCPNRPTPPFRHDQFTSSSFATLLRIFTCPLDGAHQWQQAQRLAAPPPRRLLPTEKGGHDG